MGNVAREHRSDQRAVVVVLCSVRQFLILVYSHPSANVKAHAMARDDRYAE